MAMKITGAKIQEVFPEGEVKALATITIDDCLVIRNVKIIMTNSTLIDLPAYTDEDGEHSIIFMTDDDLVNDMGEAVMDAYDSFLKKLDLQKIMKDKQV